MTELRKNTTRKVSGLCLAIMVLTLGACASRITEVHEPIDPSAITANTERITDASIRTDARYFDTLQARMASLNENGVLAENYQLCKAQAWLDLAKLEYADNDRTGVIEATIEQSIAIIESLERADLDLTFDTPIIATSEHVREDIWQFVADVKGSEHCLSCELAELDVQLVWAGHKQQQLGSRHAESSLKAAERLQRTIGTTDSCAIPATGTSTTRASSAARTRAIAPPSSLVPVELNVPRRIEFALNEFTLTDASVTAIRSFAAALHNNTDLFVRLSAYSDEHGTASYSQSLAERRAKAVKDTLTAMGISTDRVATIAFGATHPDFSGRESLSEARNRRVEMLVFLIQKHVDSASNTQSVFGSALDPDQVSTRSM